MNRLILTINTIRYLKFSQVFYRLYYRLTKPNVNVKEKIVLRDSFQSWSSPSYMKPATDDGCSFTFLGVTGRLNENWNDDAFPKLWLYNLHYQDDLNALGSKDRIELIDKIVSNWISRNPPATGNGWEPYCISLRIVNWVKWIFRNENNNIPEHWFSSLKTQAKVLEQRVEYHVLANHLFANGKALVFAGSLFSSRLGDRWLSQGLKILDKEIEEQFLQDGGHYELSPMYHSILLWDIADLINLARSSDLIELRRREKYWSNIFVRGMAWLEEMIHPDEGVSFFNDSTFGIAPSYQALKEYADYLSLAVSERKKQQFSYDLLSDSGYCVIVWDQHSKLIADVGTVGPNYQPGHAHADTLSCELSLFGNRVLVNSGISQYGTDAERNRQRSTSAHNTILVNGENSSEVWAGFRVARRAYPINVECTQSTNLIKLQAAHNGYHRLPGCVTHQRTWEARVGSLSIIDSLNGEYKSAFGFWHLHPEVKVNTVESSSVSLTLSTGEEVFVEISGAKISLESSSWHPGFGRELASTKIIFSFENSQVVTRIYWSEC